MNISGIADSQQAAQQLVAGLVSVHEEMMLNHDSGSVKLTAFEQVAQDCGDLARFCGAMRQDLNHLQTQINRLGQLIDTLR